MSRAGVPAGLSGGTPSRAAPVTAAADAQDRAHDASAERGTLVLHIRWPDRDIGTFRAAAIPTSTNAMTVRVLDSGGAVLAETSILRPAGGAPQPVVFDLASANNLSVEVKAYREASPAPGSATPIAQGAASGLNVVKSKDTTVSIHLTALFTPAIASMSTNVAREGEEITISGANLDPLDGTPPAVTLEGTGAPVSAVVTPIDAGSLRFVVPAGAAVGRVVVTRDGVPSVSSSLLWVPGGLSIAAPKAGWDPSPAGSRVVLFSETLQLSASPTWALSAGKTATSYGTPPAATWATSNGPAGSLGTEGLFTAAGAYATSSVTARIGSMQSAAIEVRSEDVTGLAIAKSASDPAGLTLTTTQTLSDGATFSGWATFATASTAVAAIDTSGSVRPASAGQMTATASSQVRSARTATATMTITITGGKAADDTGDAAVHHDYLVTKDGVTSTFVWVPVFTAYQLIVPANCGAGNTDKPAGYWVANQPPGGTQDVDWARETFGGFYAAKYEASRSDASASVKADGSDGDATAGSSGTLKIQPRCVPWTNITWDQAVNACRAYDSRADLPGDADWTAMAVWAMTHGIKVYGNNSYLRDVDSASTTFLDDPSYSGSDRALTGTGANTSWSGAQNFTTHTGTSGGVHDLNGNVWEWTGTLGMNAGGHVLVDDTDTGVTPPSGGYVTTLSADPKLRRYGVPATTGSSTALFGRDYFYRASSNNIKSLRGGGWGYGGNAGLWFLELVNDRSNSLDFIGFRPVLRSWNLIL